MIASRRKRGFVSSRLTVAVASVIQKMLTESSEPGAERTQGRACELMLLEWEVAIKTPSEENRALESPVTKKTGLSAALRALTLWDLLE